MGKSMAGHLLAAGYPLVVYNRTKAKSRSTCWRRAPLGAECPGAVAKACDVVITMVGYPKDVEETYLGENGLIAKGRQGALFIDMTTSSPALARRIAAAAKDAGMAALDAPVSGGDVGAREARLAIMVGGETADFERAKPIFDLLGTNVVHQGEAGAGQHTKMCNQIVIAGNMVGVCEALAYALRPPAWIRRSYLGRHWQRRRRQLVAEQFGTAYAGRRFCARVLCEAFY